MKKSLLILSMTLLSLTAFSQTYITKGFGKNNVTFEFKKDTIVTTSKLMGRLATAYTKSNGNELTKYYFVTANGFETRYTVTSKVIIIEAKDDFTGTINKTQMLIKEVK